ncbi:NAD(P)-binding domain-containing protein [Pseudomonas sp. NCHU5208]|uniref:NAD(P)-binding domain-containing protein n=1 Tax=unclassified Pseudomonas TaxID=196821 RepID=UPI003F9EB841
MMEHTEDFEFLILGAGPAGLQAGYHLDRAGRKYLILEGAGKPGAFFEKFPRHRKLISINKVYTGYTDPEVNLRWDWNSVLGCEADRHLFSQYSHSYFPNADKMSEYLGDYADRYGLKVRVDSKVVRVSRDGRFYVELASGERFAASVLIVATGVYTPWLPSIPGIDSVPTYCDMDIDPSTLTNKRVLILGKGNSAFETADALIEHAAMIHLASPNPLKMAWSTHYVGHLRAINNGVLDTYQLKSQNAVLDADVQAIEKVGDKYRVAFGYKHAEGEQEVIEYDQVFACTGFRFDTGIFDNSCLPALCSMGKLPEQGSDWQSSNVPDLYFAGTLMQYRDYKKYMSGFIHGFRYNVRTLCHLLLERYCDTPYPQKSCPLEAQCLTADIMARINQTSALWQQPGFLADVLVLDRVSGSVRYYEELPVDYAKEQWGGPGDEFFLLTLEFGSRKFDNPFNVPRIARDNVRRAEESNFLHPIVRHYRDGLLCAEHHVIEDLAAEWREPEHIEPVLAFIQGAVCLDESQAEALAVS